MSRTGTAVPRRRVHMVVAVLATSWSAPPSVSAPRRSAGDCSPTRPVRRRSPASTEVTVRGDAELNPAFDASVIKVPTGTMVTWTFADAGEAGEGPVAHNVVGVGFTAEVLSTGTFTHAFDDPGSYPYRCTLHLGMNGRVEVTG